MPLRAASVLDLIGNTPMIPLRRLPGAGSAEVWVKVEGRNPGGSIKDRLVRAILEEAEKEGRLRPGDTVVEASAGNTAVSLALLGAVKGYRVVLVMPETAPLERRRLLARFGAEIRLTSGGEGMAGAHKVAAQLAERNGFFLLRQFENPSGVRAHREGTGPEILQTAEGKVDAFVAGIGTGATFTGVGQCLRQHNPQVRLVAVEPARSPLLSKGRPGDHGIPGLGPDFVPPILDRSLVDEVIAVTDDDAIRTMGRLAREEGLLVGISSGANVWAALKVAQALGAGKRVVTILPDTGDRYLAFPL
ncbi:MAG: cysteine synthase A [Dehalococcoidia bacterium]|nr:cysteine synthase A [Dehalococcoidia bacterium]MDW8119914.1 cysteine synthase A [Chloroflexota bacterium]